MSRSSRVMTRACFVSRRFSSGAAVAALRPCRADLGLMLFLPAAPALRAARAGFADDAVCFDLAIGALRAVSDGTSRHHCRNPAIGNKPAGWEGSPGTRAHSAQATPTAMLRSPRQSSPICAGGAADSNQRVQGSNSLHTHQQPQLLSQIEFSSRLALLPCDRRSHHGCWRGKRRRHRGA